MMNFVPHAPQPKVNVHTLKFELVGLSLSEEPCVPEGVAASPHPTADHQPLRIARGPRIDYTQWRKVMLCLLAVLVLPGAGYVISAWACTNPMHMTAFNHESV